MSTPTIAPITNGMMYGLHQFQYCGILDGFSSVSLSNMPSMTENRFSISFLFISVRWDKVSFADGCHFSIREATRHPCSVHKAEKPSSFFLFWIFLCCRLPSAVCRLRRRSDFVDEFIECFDGFLHFVATKRFPNFANHGKGSRQSGKEHRKVTNDGNKGFHGYFLVEVTVVSILSSRS